MTQKKRQTQKKLDKLDEILQKWKKNGIRKEW